MIWKTRTGNVKKMFEVTAKNEAAKRWVNPTLI